MPCWLLSWQTQKNQKWLSPRTRRSQPLKETNSLNHLTQLTLMKNPMMRTHLPPQQDQKRILLLRLEGMVIITDMLDIVVIVIAALVAIEDSDVISEGS